jgi:uncharacterized membrane protein
MNAKIAMPTLLGLTAAAKQLGRRQRRGGRLKKLALPSIRRVERKSDGRLFALGMGSGALLMYLFDARWGDRRRALARDQVTRLANQAGDALDKSAQDLKNRAAGLVAEAQPSRSEESAPDEVLAARVREALGRTVSHPRAVDVSASDGRIVLSGPILKRDVKRFLGEVRHVRGVREVENRLQVHRRPGNVPDLQGQPNMSRMKPELAQENWTPGVRMLVGLAGTALAAATFTVGGAPRIAGGALGLGLLARSLTNLPVKRLLGIGSGRRAVDIQKTINIDAPVEEVFAFYSNFENFPRFMANIREVRNLGDDRSSWVAEGPAGITAQWDAIITKFEPNRTIAWRSEPGSLVGNAGIVRFDPNPDGGTRITVRMSYNPPAGALGHAVATLFNRNPKQQMDEDLVRLKSLLETGKTTADGEQVRREEFMPTPGVE